MFVLVWEFVVPERSTPDFRTAYGPEGAWAALFRRAEGYRGTELLCDEKAPTRFVTIDRWDSRAAWESFRARFDGEYRTLDAHCDALTERETPLGAFDTVD